MFNAMTFQTTKKNTKGLDSAFFPCQILDYFLHVFISLFMPYCHFGTASPHLKFIVFPFHLSDLCQNFHIREVLHGDTTFLWSYRIIWVDRHL